MLRLAFDFIITWRETRTRPNAYALRIVSLMPQWKPGRQNGKAERVRYTLPIIFNPSIKESDMIE